jgi:ferredoxin
MHALRHRTRVPNWVPVDINISTRPNGNQDTRWTNRENRLQGACNGCGDCVTGCRQGAKNTLDMNYLASAKRNHAEIFTEVSVERIEPTSRG